MRTGLAGFPSGHEAVLHASSSRGSRDGKRVDAARPFPPRPAAGRMAFAPRIVLASLSSREWRNWQTRWLQVPVFERTWGFKSPLAHSGLIAVMHIPVGQERPPRNRGPFVVSRVRRCTMLR